MMTKKEPLVHSTNNPNGVGIHIARNRCNGATTGHCTGWCGVCSNMAHKRVTCPKCKAKLRKAKR